MIPGTPHTVCSLCGADGPNFVVRGGRIICVGCYHQISSLVAENAQLRARLQVAQSSLRELIRELDYDLATPRTHGDLAHARGVLLAARRALDDTDTPLCTVCHRPLVVPQVLPQVLDHIETEAGWECLPCRYARQEAERASAPTAPWAPLQGGDLPQTPR